MPTIQSLTSYSDLELALMVLLGYFGNGQERKNRLGSRYDKAQAIVEQILQGTVPAGSGTATIKKAVAAVFQETINEIVKEINNEL